VRWQSKEWLDFVTDSLGDPQRLAASLGSGGLSGAPANVIDCTSHFHKLLLSAAMSVGCSHHSEDFLKSSTGLDLSSFFLDLSSMPVVAAQCRERIEEASSHISDVATQAGLLPVTCLFDCFALCATSPVADPLHIEICDAVIDGIEALCSCCAFPEPLRTELPVCKSTLAWALSGASDGVLAASLPGLLARLGPPVGSDSSTLLALQLVQPSVARAVLNAAERSLPHDSALVHIAWAWLKHAACTVGMCLVYPAGHCCSAAWIVYSG
jgi:hypothetical protein